LRCRRDWISFQEILRQRNAAMLGTRREGVTEAAVKFQVAGLISYSRARIRVLDKAGLKGSPASVIGS
jgi:hypothetical protein